MSIETVIKFITFIQVVQVPKMLWMMYNAVSMRGELTPYLFLNIFMAAMFILCLGIEDNTTLAGRRLLLIVYVIFVVPQKPFKIYETFEFVGWASSYAKVICEDNPGPKCESRSQTDLMIGAVVDLVLAIHFTRILYKYYRLKIP